MKIRIIQFLYSNSLQFSDGKDKTNIKMYIDALQTYIHSFYSIFFSNHS